MYYVMRIPNYLLIPIGFFNIQYSQFLEFKLIKLNDLQIRIGNFI